MKIEITLRARDVDMVRPFLDDVRSFARDLTVLEAPGGLDYSYAFPVVTVIDSTHRDRHFGEEAVELLREFAKKPA